MIPEIPFSFYYNPNELIDISQEECLKEILFFENTHNEMVVMASFSMLVKLPVVKIKTHEFSRNGNDIQHIYMYYH